MRVFLLMTGGVIIPVIFVCQVQSFLSAKYKKLCDAVGKVFRRNPDRRSDFAQRSTTFSLKTDH